MTSKAHKTQENSLLSITSLLQRIQLMNREIEEMYRATGPEMLCPS